MSSYDFYIHHLAYTISKLTSKESKIKFRVSNDLAFCCSHFRAPQFRSGPRNGVASVEIM